MLRGSFRAHSDYVTRPCDIESMAVFDHLFLKDGLG